MDFRTIYDQHVNLAWRTLSRLGVPRADLPDAVQETFLVAHRKLPTFEGRSTLATWIVGICYRIASDRRKLAHVRHEVDASDHLAGHTDGRPDPETTAAQREEVALLDAILTELPAEQRAVFVLFELEGLSGKEIADIVNAPIKTVFSRLRLAREAFASALQRPSSVRPLLGGRGDAAVRARRGQAL
jgi:RNA polymerase sigma-70 factor (ECF subfamily)